jgi:hypothetical protein
MLVNNKIKIRLNFEACIARHTGNLNASHLSAGYLSAGYKRGRLRQLGLKAFWFPGVVIDYMLSDSKLQTSNSGGFCAGK